MCAATGIDELLLVLLLQCCHSDIVSRFQQKNPGWRGLKVELMCIVRRISLFLKRQYLTNSLKCDSTYPTHPTYCSYFTSLTIMSCWSDFTWVNNNILRMEYRAWDLKGGRRQWRRRSAGNDYRKHRWHYPSKGATACVRDFPTHVKRCDEQTGQGVKAH